MMYIYSKISIFVALISAIYQIYTYQNLLKYFFFAQQSVPEKLQLVFSCTKYDIAFKTYVRYIVLTRMTQWLYICVCVQNSNLGGLIPTKLFISTILVLLRAIPLYRYSCKSCLSMVYICKAEVGLFLIFIIFRPVITFKRIYICVNLIIRIWSFVYNNIIFSLRGG